MINGIGVVGWGVGGIEAEAGMLGQPVYFLTPDVVGVELKGKLSEGITATDLVLTVTEMLRKEKVVGKFVEFFGEGAASLAVPDRATIANMAPEYGATMGFFPVDDATVDYLHGHRPHRRGGRSVRGVLQGAGPVRHAAGRRDRLHEGRDARPRDDQGVARRTEAPAGPHRARQPQADVRGALQQAGRRERLRAGGRKLARAFRCRNAAGAAPTTPAASRRRTAQRRRDGRQPADAGSRAGHRRRRHRQRRRADRRDHLVHEHVEPRRAARRGPAREEGRRERPHGRRRTSRRRSRPARASSPSTSTKAGLLPYLEQLGFDVAAYGCTTCIGNAGDLDARDQRRDHRERPRLRGGAVRQPQLRGAHPSEPEGELPRLAAARRRVRDRRHGAEGPDDGAARHRHATASRCTCKDIWPTSHEIAAVLPVRARRRDVSAGSTATSPNANPLWRHDRRRRRARSTTGRSRPTSRSRRSSTASRCTPARHGDITGARALGIFGDSVTTDHISPGGLDQAEPRPRAAGCSSTTSPSPTSTATARAAATTR